MVRDHLVTLDDHVKTFIHLNLIILFRSPGGQPPYRESSTTRKLNCTSLNLHFSLFKNHVWHTVYDHKVFLRIIDSYSKLITHNTKAQISHSVYVKVFLFDFFGYSVCNVASYYNSNLPHVLSNVRISRCIFLFLCTPSTHRLEVLKQNKHAKTDDGRWWNWTCHIKEDYLHVKSCEVNSVQSRFNERQQSGVSVSKWCLPPWSKYAEVPKFLMPALHLFFTLSRSTMCTSCGSAFLASL